MTIYTVQIEEDPDTGELILPFPPELIAELGWVEGDTLVWTINEDNTVTIKKSDE